MQAESFEVGVHARSVPQSTAAGGLAKAGEALLETEVYATVHGGLSHAHVAALSKSILPRRVAKVLIEGAK